MACVTAMGLQLSVWHTPALADEVTGHRNPAGFVERDHSIRAVAHPGYLELVVRRTIENMGKDVDEASVSIELPDAQIATNLRSQGMVGGRAVWFQGELLDAEVARDRYEYLTGYGQALPKDPAWLYWTSPNSLGLQVFPCAPHQPKTVEYRLIAPMPYADGRYSVQFSPLGSAMRHATFELSAAKARDRVWLNQHELLQGSRVRGPVDATEIRVELESEQQSLVEGELTQVALGTERSYLRAELRAKAKLSTIPRQTQLVFLFDMSRSIGASWELQRRLFEQVASQFPDTRVAAWGFDRAARPITEGFVSFEEAREKLEAYPKQTRNGSRVDLALKAAIELFGRSRGQRARNRVFLLTDAQVAARIGDARIEAAVGALPATVQLVEVSEGSCDVSPASAMPWAKAVEATTGMAWSVSTNGGAEDCLGEVEELARPKRLFVKAITLEGAAVELEIPENLDEGQSFVHEAIVTGRAKLLGFEARLWGQRVSSQFSTDGAMSRIRAALATANNDFDLTDPELKTLARAGGAVTRLTSYLAIEPGVRPSSDGFEAGTGSGQGFGSGHGRLGGSHATRGLRTPFNRQAYIEGAVDEARKYCGVGFLRANVELETNLAELLDVVRAEVPDAPASASGCLIERLWELNLPSQFDQARATFMVAR